MIQLKKNTPQPFAVNHRWIPQVSEKVSPGELEESIIEAAEFLTGNQNLEKLSDLHKATQQVRPRRKSS